MQKIKKHLTMKELPVTERPYEKCEKNGAGTLSDAELLAIILKTGTRGDKVMDLAVQLLNLNPSCPGLEGIMGLELAEDTRHWTGQSRSVGRCLRVVQKDDPHSVQ